LLEVSPELTRQTGPGFKTTMPGLHKEAIGQLKHKTPRGKTVQFICKDHGIMPFD